MSPSYFQTPKVLELGAQSTVDFVADVRTGAQKILSEHNVGNDFSIIHVRTGDYKSWPSVTEPAVLPTAWIESAADRLRQTTGNNPIIVLGDNYEDSRMIADRLQALHVRESEAVDMCIISMAKAGVLSASTFALWGANFARRRLDARGPWFAPKFWGGIRLGRWYPPNLVVDWLTYLPVDKFLLEEPDWR